MPCSLSAWWRLSPVLPTRRRKPPDHATGIQHRRRTRREPSTGPLSWGQSKRTRSAPHWRRCRAAPDRIEVVAADEVLPEIRDRIHRKFGFVLKGSRTIYLIRDSAIIREADRSGGPYLFMLAAVIWHEMAHADGLDEAQARRREEELWRGFVSTRVVDSAVRTGVSGRAPCPEVIRLQVSAAHRAFAIRWRLKFHF